MIRNLFTLYIETVFTVLQYPGDLPGLLAHRQLRPGFIAIILIFPALSASVGIYYLRDYYSASFAIEGLIYFLMHYVFFWIWGILFGSLLNATVVFFRGERRDSSRVMIQSAVLSVLPFSFAAPASMTMSMIETPGLYYAGSLGIFAFWSVYISFQAMRHHYELSMRSSLNSVLITLLAMILFPPVAIAFIFFGAMEVLR